jgi:hypothetical protein
MECAIDPMRLFVTGRFLEDLDVLAPNGHRHIEGRVEKFGKSE